MLNNKAKLKKLSEELCIIFENVGRGLIVSLFNLGFFIFFVLLTKPSFELTVILYIYSAFAGAILGMSIGLYRGKEKQIIHNEDCNYE